MPYPFKQIFAADPSNPDVVAGDAEVLIFAPGDVNRVPLAITDPTGVALPNPIKTNEKGFASAFISALPQVAWEGAGLTGFLESFEGMRVEAAQAAVEAVSARQEAATAATAATQAATTAAAQVTVELSGAVTAAQQAAADAANAANLVGAPAEAAIATVLANPDSQAARGLKASFVSTKGRPLNAADFDSLGEMFTLAATEAEERILEIPPGFYPNVDALRIDHPGISVHADGAHIERAAGATASLLAAGPEGVNTHIIGGRWDANKANTTVGHTIEFEEYVGGFRVADRSNLERCEILNSPQDGLRIGRRRVEVKARRCQVRDVGRHGVFLGGTDSAFVDGAVGLCAVTGIWNENISNWIVHNGIYSSGTGIRLTEGSRGSHTHENTIDVNDGYGLHIEGTSSSRAMDAEVIGNLFLSNGQKLDPATSADIFIQNASGVAFGLNTGSKKVGTWNLPAYAIRFGTGVADISRAGGYWEPAAYTVGAYSDPALIALTTHRLSIGAASANALVESVRVGNEPFPRYEVLADGTQRFGPGTSALDVNLYRGGADVLKTDDALLALRYRMAGTAGGGYYHHYAQSSTPGPEADSVKTFSRKNGAGKMELCAVLPTGAVQIIATEA